VAAVTNCSLIAAPLLAMPAIASLNCSTDTDTTTTDDDFAFDMIMLLLNIASRYCLVDEFII
jgi:hypothetical protein